MPLRSRSCQDLERARLCSSAVDNLSKACLEVKLLEMSTCLLLSRRAVKGCSWQYQYQLLICDTPSLEPTGVFFIARCSPVFKHAPTALSFQ